MINNELESALVITDAYHVFKIDFYSGDVSWQWDACLVQPAGDHWYKPAWFFSTRRWKATISEYSKLVALLFGVREDDSAVKRVVATTLWYSVFVEEYSTGRTSAACRPLGSATAKIRRADL